MPTLTRKSFLMAQQIASLTRLAGLVLSVLLLIGSAPVNASREAALEPGQQKTVRQVGAYFNKLRHLQGEFVQVGPRGRISRGVFYMSKPGKLRFEYAPPNPFLVVADGTWVIVNNRRKNKAEHYPLSATPLRLVLAEKVDLLKEARIIHVANDKKILTLTMEDREQLVAGQLTVVFDADTMTLREWVIVDGQGLRTTISLKSLKDGVKADPKLFEVKMRKEIRDIDRR